MKLWWHIPLIRPQRLCGVSRHWPMKSHSTALAYFLLFPLNQALFQKKKSLTTGTHWQGIYSTKQFPQAMPDLFIRFNTQSLPHLYLLSYAMIIDGQHHSPEVQELTDSSEGDAIMFIGPDGLWQQRGLGDWEGMKLKIFWLTLSMPNLKAKDFIVHIILDGRKKD